AENDTDGAEHQRGRAVAVAGDAAVVDVRAAFGGACGDRFDRRGFEHAWLPCPQLPAASGIARWPRGVARRWTHQISTCCPISITRFGGTPRCRYAPYALRNM